MKPIYAIRLDGRDITPTFDPRLESLSITDNRGFEADMLDITLDDSDGRLTLPERGVKIGISLGWADTGLIDKGTYIVDEVEHSGTPDKLTIRARSADLRTGLAVRQERSWAGKKLIDIVRSVAAKHGLQARVSAKLAGVVIAHIDQTSESDANLLTRLARDVDAIATVKSGCLLCMPIGEAESVTGKPFPRATITRAQGDGHSFSMAERDTYTAVTARYQNVKGAATGIVTVDASGVQKPSGKSKSLAPSTDSTKVLRHTYATQSNAERAAKAEWQRLQRGVANFRLTLARGRPDLFPELPVTVQGWKPEIDSADWLIAKATHSLSGSGLTTALELELRPA